MRVRLLLPAVATLFGMTVGVGMFGLPLVVSRIGVSTSMLMAVGVAALVIVTHLLYAEVVRLAPVRLRLSQATARAFGPTAGRVVFVSNMLGTYGALLAYVIAAGIFSATALGISDPFFLQLFFFVLMSVVALRGRSAVSQSEIPLVMLLVGAMCVLVLFALPVAHISYLTPTMPDDHYLFIAYGVLLFSFGALPAIPTLVELLRNRPPLLRRAILLGTGSAVVTTMCFAVVIAAVTGPETSEEGIRGLLPYVGSTAVTLGAIVGVLAVVTSFLALAVHARDVFLLDLKLPKPVAWACTLLPPLVLFLVGARQLLPVIAVTGAVFMGIDGIAVAAIAWKTRRRVFGTWLPLLVAVCYSLGLVAHLTGWWSGR